MERTPRLRVNSNYDEIIAAERDSGEDFSLPLKKKRRLRSDNKKNENKNESDTVAEETSASKSSNETGSSGTSPPTPDSSADDSQEKMPPPSQPPVRRRPGRPKGSKNSTVPKNQTETTAHLGKRMTKPKPDKDDENIQQTNDSVDRKAAFAKTTNVKPNQASQPRRDEELPPLFRNWIRRMAFANGVDENEIEVSSRYVFDRGNYKPGRHPLEQDEQLWPSDEEEDEDQEENENEPEAGDDDNSDQVSSTSHDLPNPAVDIEEIPKVEGNVTLFRYRE